MVQANNFDFSLLPSSTVKDNSDHNNIFLIAQTQKQLVAAFEEDVCNQNGKHATPLSPCPLPINIISTTNTINRPHHSPLYTIFPYSHILFYSIFCQSTFAYLMFGT